jgi:predicted CxxxxCH...CXXCH cytochrome family protein
VYQTLGAAVIGVSLSVTALFACTSARTDTTEAPTYRDDVGELLRAKCAGCHAGAAPPAGWAADNYGPAVGCIASGASAIAPAGDRPAPIVAALARPDHVTLLTPDERSRLERWVAGGAPSTRGGAHPRAFFDPRSPDSHGNFLRAKRYAPMLDASDGDACGRCHDGVPIKPGGFAFAAPGATACTSCHDEPGGTLGCGTCHGAPGKLYPPRDPCFHPEAAADRSHAPHAGPTVTHADGLACSTCHPQPAAGVLGGTHADGFVEVWFDYARAGRDARFDPATKACAGTCHARGGARPAVTWNEALASPMTCNDCHRSPPPNHYQGACTSCHREANANGTALSAPKLHVNGRVDLGDGSGTCGACHGQGDSPWPSTGAHPAHAAPAEAKPVACETCHDVPGPGDRHPVGRGAAAVRLLGLAANGGRRATYDPATKTCAGTYCHEGSGASRPAPRWTDGPAARACGACHASPPPSPHPATSACEQCHGPRTNATHVDGFVTR